MANQYHIADLPGGLAKAERLIFPTDASRVPPTNEDDVPQAGVELGNPEPQDGNVSDDGVSLGVAGRLRQDAATDPTIRVRFEDLVGIPSRSSVGGVLDAVFEASAKNRLRVPRYSIRRTNYDQGDDAGQVGVLTSWALFQELDVDPPSKGASTVGQGPAFAIDRRGNLLVAWAATETSTGDGFVVVYRYKPHAATTFEHLLTIDVDAESGRSGVPVYDLELIEYRGDVYVLLGVENASSKPALQVYLLQGTDGAAASAVYVTETFTTLGGSQPETVAAAATEGGLVVAVMESLITPLRIGLTQDLRNFDEVSGDAGIVSFSEFRQAFPGELGSVADIVGVSATELWAVTGEFDPFGQLSGGLGGGSIMRSLDGGKSWAGITNPALAWNNVAEHPVPLNSIAKFSDTILVVGPAGLVMRSTDAGANWKVIRYAGGSGADRLFTAGQIEATEVEKVDLPNLNLRKIKMISATRAWVVGDSASIYYTADAGSTWVEIQHLGTPGAYVDFVVDDGASGNVLLAIGTASVHVGGGVTSTDQGKVAALVTDAESAGSAAVTYLLGQDVINGAAQAITVERNGDNPAPNGASTLGYVLGRAGQVFRFAGNGTTVAFTEIATLKPEGNAFLDIHSPDQDTGGTTGDIVVTAAASQNGPGIVFQASSAHTGTDVAFTGQHISQAPTALWMDTVSSGAIGTTRTLWQAFEGQNLRLFPDLLAHADGSVLFVCLNGSKKWVEVYFAPRPAPGQRPNFRLLRRIDAAIGNAPRLAHYHDGSIILAIGKKHWIGRSGGRSAGDWVPASDLRLPLPLSDHLTDADYTDAGGGDNSSVQQRRALTEYLGGVLFSAVPDATGAKIGIFRAWHWDAAGVYYRPSHQGLHLSLGVDGALMNVTGEPAPGDEWVISPRHLYSVAALAGDSPSAEVWRSKTDSDQLDIIYDAQHAAVTDAIGARTFWSGSFFAVFGSTFGRAAFAISDPSDAGVFTAKDVTVVIDSGTATGPASVLVSNVLRVAGKTWTPGQWAPGPRQFFARFQNQDLAYRIVANGADWLEVDGEVDLSGSSSARSFQIYSDRIIWDGTDGSGPGSAGLLGTDYQHGRLIYLTVPAQPTPDGFFEAGRFFVGQEVPRGVDEYSFLYGSKFRPVTNTEQDVSKGGIKSIRHYGRTGRLWEVEFPRQSPDAVGRKLNALLSKMREPFVIQWIGDDIQTATLVRLVDASDITNATGNYFSVPYLLEEVQ